MVAQGAKTTASVRSITISAVTAELLTDHVARYSAPGPDGLVFTNKAGNPLISSSFWQHYFQPALRRSGVACRFHDLRNTSVALAIAEGAHPKAIQTRMGHSSINVTLDRYGHLFPELDEALAVSFGERLTEAQRMRQERQVVVSRRLRRRIRVVAFVPWTDTRSVVIPMSRSWRASATPGCRSRQSLSTSRFAEATSTSTQRVRALGRTSATRTKTTNPIMNIRDDKRSRHARTADISRRAAGRSVLPYPPPWPPTLRVCWRRSPAGPRRHRTSSCAGVSVSTAPTSSSGLRTSLIAPSTQRSWATSPAPSVGSILRRSSRLERWVLSRRLPSLPRRNPLSARTECRWNGSSPARRPRSRVLRRSLMPSLDPHALTRGEIQRMVTRFSDIPVA